MTRDDAKRIMENLAIISHYAAGGDIEFPMIRSDGVFLHWLPARTMTMCCLGKYRITGTQAKVRVKLNPQQLRDADPVCYAAKTKHGNCK